MITDPIADLLTRLRNGYMAGIQDVTAPYSKIKYSICKIFEKNKIISDVKVEKDDNGFQFLRIKLNELADRRSCPKFKRVSKPGQRIYVPSKNIKKVLGGYGLGLVSTPKGIMTTYEANKQNLGGEYICEIS